MIRSVCLAALLVAFVAPAAAQEATRFPLHWRQQPSQENGFPSGWELEFSPDANRWTAANLVEPIASSPECWAAAIEEPYPGGYVRARATGPAGFSEWSVRTVPEPSGDLVALLAVFALAGWRRARGGLTQAPVARS